MRAIKKGSTDQSVVIRIVDSGDGTPETGVVFNTAGIDLWYRREGAVKTSITEATLSALNDAHSDGGILHIGDGYYRLDLPDAAFATGANGVMIGGTVTGMVVIGCYVPLVDFDPQDAVRAGLTALPNAAADAAGGLPISDAGGLDLDAQRTDVAAILVDTADIQPKVGTPAGASVSADIAAVKAQTAAIEVDTQDLQTQVGVDGAGLTAIGDTRLANLDAAVSSRASAAALTTAQTDLDTLTGADGATLATTQANYAPAKAGDAMALTSGERTTLAAVIWNALTSGMSTVGSIGKKLADWTIHSAADVWAAATRTLTAGTNIALAKGTGVTGFTDLSAADVRTAVGLASANLDTQLATIDTVADAVKAKTDSLTFTEAGQVDANVQSVNDVALTGDGSAGTPWGPA